MEISFRTRRLARVFGSERELRREYGSTMARAIVTRMNVLRQADDLTQVPTIPPERRHALTGQRIGQYAVDLTHPRRLVFVPNHTPIPTRGDGGVDTDRVTSVEIIEIIDYH